MLNANQGPTLSITAVSGINLLNKDMVGKQDPYAQFSLDPHNPKAFQKTFTHKDAGKNATWNQSFDLPLHGEPDLYVEVFDEDPTADEVIGFAAIPINQVVYAPGGSFNGVFDIYQINGKGAGEVRLVLTVQGLPNAPSSPGSGFGYQQQQQQPTRGQSYINENHAKRIKTLRNKAIATDVGIATLGGALAVGAGLLGSRFLDNHHKEEENRKHEAASMHEERERYEREKHNFDEERARFERQQSEHSNQQGHQHGENCHHDHDRGHEHHGHQERHGHHGRDWDPVGTYAAGDRVEYHGRTYVCLQGHSSNPTWMPDAAHSLWQTA
jgi:hypothetical protein